MEPSSSPTTPPARPLPIRRSLFRWLTYALGALASAVVGLPFVGYIFGARNKPVPWVPLGPVKDFPPGETRLMTFDNPISQPWDGMAAHTGVYVRSEGQESGPKDQFLVFAVNCAHLGCPVSWFPQSGLFMCPCHGGVYYANGERAAGPPRAAFSTAPWRVRDGQLEVQAPHYPTLQDPLGKPS